MSFKLKRSEFTHYQFVFVVRYWIFYVRSHLLKNIFIAIYFNKHNRCVVICIVVCCCKYCVNILFSCLIVVRQGDKSISNIIFNISKLLQTVLEAAHDGLKICNILLKNRL